MMDGGKRAWPSSGAEMKEIESDSGIRDLSLTNDEEMLHVAAGTEMAMVNPQTVPPAPSGNYGAARASEQEVNEVTGRDSLVPTPGSHPASLVASAKDQYHLRMELSQKDATISDLEKQGAKLKKKLETSERDKEQLVNELSMTQKNLEKAEEENQSLRDQIKVKEKEIEEYKQRIADMEKESKEAKEQIDATKRECEEKLRHLEQDLNEALKSLELANQDRIEMITRIGDLRVKLADKNTEVEKLQTDNANQKRLLAEALLEKERLQNEKKQKEMEEKHRNSLSEVEKRRREAEQKQCEAEQKHRNSLTEIEVLKRELDLIKLRLGEIPEDHPDSDRDE